MAAERCWRQAMPPMAVTPLMKPGIAPAKSRTLHAGARVAWWPPRNKIETVISSAPISRRNGVSVNQARRATPMEPKPAKPRTTPAAQTTPRL